MYGCNIKRYADPLNAMFVLIFVAKCRVVFNLDMLKLKILKLFCMKAQTFHQIKECMAL